MDFIADLAGDFAYYYAYNFAKNVDYGFLGNIPFLGIFNICFLLITGYLYFLLPKYNEVIYTDYKRSDYDDAKYFLTELISDVSKFEADTSSMIHKYSAMDEAKLKLFEIPRLSRDLGNEMINQSFASMRDIDYLLLKASFEEFPSVVPIYLEKPTNFTSVRINTILNIRDALLKLNTDLLKYQSNIHINTIDLLVSISKDQKSTFGMRRRVCHLLTMIALQKENCDNLLSSGAYRVIKYYSEKKIEGTESFARLNLAAYHKKSITQNNFPKLSANEYMEIKTDILEYNIIKLVYNVFSFIIIFILLKIFLFDYSTSLFYALLLGTEIIHFIANPELKFLTYVIFNFVCTKYWGLIIILKGKIIQFFMDSHVYSKTVFVPIKYADEQLFYMTPDILDTKSA